jgi:hypothetical protein
VEPLIRRVRTVAVVAALATAIGCSGLGGAADAGVTIEDAWARTTPPGTASGAVYLTLSSPDGDTLLGAAVDASVAAAAELHMTMTDEASGDTVMHQLESVAAPRGAPVVFEPGGNHVMLVDLAAPLAAGASFPLTLRFATAGERVVEVEVRSESP